MTDRVQTTSPENETLAPELTAAELERVDGGSGVNVLMADGSVRFAGKGDYQWLTHLDRG